MYQKVLDIFINDQCNAFLRIKGWSVAPRNTIAFHFFNQNIFNSVFNNGQDKKVTPSGTYTSGIAYERSMIIKTFTEIKESNDKPVLNTFTEIKHWDS